MMKGNGDSRVWRKMRLPFFVKLCYASAKRFLLKRFWVTFVSKLTKYAMSATKNTPKKWYDLGVKDQAALITACASFLLGFVLLFLGMFIDPAGEIDGSVLTAFGTALLYAAGIFGVAMYFKQGNTELMNNIMNATEKMIEKRMNNDKEEIEDGEN